MFVLQCVLAASCRELKNVIAVWDHCPRIVDLLPGDVQLDKCFIWVCHILLLINKKCLLVFCEWTQKLCSIVANISVVTMYYFRIIFLNFNLRYAAVLRQYCELVGSLQRILFLMKTWQNDENWPSDESTVFWRHLTNSALWTITALLLECP